MLKSLYRIFRMGKTQMAGVWRLFECIGLGTRFTGAMLLGGCFSRQSLWLSCEQVWQVGRLPFLVTILSGICTGAVLFLQAYILCVPLQMQEQISCASSLPLVREFGPVLSAWLFAGVVGSAMTAETGLMKSSDQILSLELMGIDPLGRIFFPKFIAALILLPILTFLFITIGLLSSAYTGAFFFNFELARFWNTLWDRSIFWKEEAVWVLRKSLIFASLVGVITLAMGYFSKPTSEGVSDATVRSVTWSLASILLGDWICALLYLNV